MKGVFITGTDTGAGKSVVAGLLGYFLSKKGYKTITQKWVQTGSGPTRPGCCDVKTHLKLMRRRRRDIQKYLPYVLPYNFTFPASPHLAASLEKKKIDSRRIKKSFRALSDDFDFVIAEGAGGALTPLSRTGFLIDIARELGLPAIIVAGNRLGAVNHALLTIEALKGRGIKIIGVVFNNCHKGVSRIVLDDNPRTVGLLGSVAVLGSLPMAKNTALLAEAFSPIGGKILAFLEGGLK